MSDDQKKFKVLSLLQQEVAPKQISDDLDVSYSRVLRWKKEFDEAKEQGTVAALLEVDRAVIAEAAGILPVEEAVTQLTKGLDGLENLSTELQGVATSILLRTKSMIVAVEHASELEILTDITCKIQSAFLNKNQTQVNVQNNFGAENNGAKRYASFLGDAPGQPAGNNGSPVQ